MVRMKFSFVTGSEQELGQHALSVGYNISWNDDDEQKNYAEKNNNLFGSDVSLYAVSG